MNQNLEEKLKQFGIKRGINTDAAQITKVIEVLETLRQHLGYKTVDVAEWYYTGGHEGQVKRVKELAGLGEKALVTIRELAKTGYKLDDFWDSKSSIGKGDIEVIAELSEEGMLERYLSLLDKVRHVFKAEKFNYTAMNASNLMSLLELSEQDFAKVSLFLKNSGCFFFFNDKSFPLKSELESIINSDHEITSRMFENLRRNFNYKTLYAKGYLYNSEVQEQIKRVLKIARLGEKALEVLDALASTGYKLDDYCGGRTSIKEEDIEVITTLLKDNNLEKYLLFLNKAWKVLRIKRFSYKAPNALFMINLSFFAEKDYTNILWFLSYCNYTRMFEKGYENMDTTTLKSVAKANLGSVKEVFKNLKKNFGYKTVNVNLYDYTRGAEGQIERILKISEIGEEALQVLDTLAKTGYRLDTHWDSKGSIGQEDLTLIRKLLNEEEFKKYLSFISRVKDLFKKKTEYRATNALSMMELLKFGEEKAFNIVNFLKRSGYTSSFNKNDTKLPDYILEKVANSDPEIVNKVFEKLNKNFGYKTVKVADWGYTGGVKGQTGRVLEIASLGGKALQVLDVLAETGYELDAYWDSKGSIGEIDIDIIRKLSGTNTAEKYKQVVSMLKKIGYKEKNRYKERELYEREQESILKITLLPGEVSEALTQLTKEGYRINGYVEVPDVEYIGERAEKLWDKKFENVKLEHKCFYKEDAKAFIENFSNIKDPEYKKKIIKALMNCSYENKEAIKWLDENEPKLIREVGLLL